MGMWLLHLLQYEVITGLRNELLCYVSWTGCWVMCFMRHEQTCQPLLVIPVPSLSFPSSIFHPPFLFHTTLVTHCVARQGHVGSQLIRAKKSWILCVCVRVCVHARGRNHKNNGKHLTTNRPRGPPLLSLLLDAMPFVAFLKLCLWQIPQIGICRKHIRAFTGPGGPLGQHPSSFYRGHCREQDQAESKCPVMRMF